MRGSKFPQATRALRAPKGQNEDDCVPLYVYQDGELVISRWELDDDDRARIAAGGPIWLLVRGVTMPPSAMTTVDPWCVDGGAK